MAQAETSILCHTGTVFTKKSLFPHGAKRLCNRKKCIEFLKMYFKTEKLGDAG